MSDKIVASLAEAMVAPGAPQEHRIIVRYKAGVTAANRPLAGIVRPQHFSLIPAAALQASADQIDALAADPAVERIWPDMLVHTCLDASVPHINAPQVWAAGFTGRNVPVAIVDTGIDPGHPDFAARISAMEDFTGEGPRDNHGHGTHVAGIVAGAGNRYKGVAPEARIYAAKVLHGNGSGYMSEVMAGLEWAVEQKVKVINLSLGGVGPCDGTDALSVTCDAAVDNGVMVCVAAGNYGPTASSVGPPGCARKVLTVGAASKADAIASFSARGPTADGRVKPDLLLPGVDIVSCRAQGTTMGSPVDTLYTRASGTSMATPHAAGVVALLLEAFPALTPAQLKERMMNTAINLNLDANTQGRGRADAYAAYQGTPSPPGPPPSQPGGCLLSLLNLFTPGH
jgi:subtilisin family serine protease